MIKQTFHALLAITLVACGGGGSGSSNDDTPSTEVTATQDIVTTEEFAFKTSWNLDVDFTIPGASGTRFLSLCTNFDTLSGGSYDVDYDSCLVRSIISGGTYEASLAVSDEVTKLVAAVWEFSESGTPIYKEFSLENGQTTLNW